MVVIPYVSGLTEKLQCIYRKHKTSMVVKPHRTLKSYLVHPKDKIEDKKKVVMCIVSHVGNCDSKCIQETGRPLGVRIEEHCKEADKTSAGNYTRSARRTSE